MFTNFSKCPPEGVREDARTPLKEDQLWPIKMSTRKFIRAMRQCKMCSTKGG